MYLFGFAGAWLLGSYRAKSRQPWNNDRVGDLIFYCALGVVLGGRLGYILFYDLAHYLDAPLDVFKVWRGGMSFHGGLIGVIVAMWLFGRKQDIHFLRVVDFVAPLVPVGLFTGRIGNFINGELWGKVTDSPLGMAVFDPQLQAVVVKYPTQLLEALLEGLVLLLLLLWYARKPRPAGSVGAMFLIGYGSFRFLVEFWRMPDAHIGYLAWDWLTMGQVLSAPMIIVGILIIMWSKNRAKQEGLHR
jgi:phosphatidylglycerol:prolipoprotein diacylglycerol transferase